MSGKTGLQAAVLCLLAIFLVLPAGCGKKEIIFTTGLGRDEVFKIEGEICSLAEARFLLQEMKRGYETSFGKELWSQEVNGTTVEEYAKQRVIDQLAEIKCMKLLAGEQGIELSEEETAKAKSAADEKYQVLGEDAEELDLDKEQLEAIYLELSLADKVYQQLTSEVNTEVSDDEARAVAVQQIYTKSQSLAEEALQKARTGEDFSTLAENYNEGKVYQTAYGRGELASALEEAIFSLANDEISEVVQAEDGFYIFKCLNNYDVEATDANKAVIAKKRKEEAFQEVYDPFVKGLHSEFNRKLWESVE